MAGCISKINGCEVKDKTAREQIAVVNGRINSIVATAGDTGNNAELIDIRTAYNGVVHPTAGEAVRNQIREVKAETESLMNSIFEAEPIALPAEYTGTAKVTVPEGGALYYGTRNVLQLANIVQGTFTGYGVTITVDGTTVTINGTVTNPDPAGVGMYFSMNDGGFKDYTAELETGGLSIPARSYDLRAKTVRGSYFPTVGIRRAGGNVVAVQPDINSVSHPFSTTSDTNGHLYIFCGTGKTLDCVFNIGLYTDSNTIPDGSASIVNKITESGMYQLYGFVWADGNAAAANLVQKAAESVTPEKVKRPMCKYLQISVDYTGATEVLDVYIPAEVGYTRVRFGNCTHAEDGGLCWRILQFCAVDDDLAVRFKITQYGETEMAVQIVGRDDFIGGYTHGDEIRVDGSFMLLLDGKITDVTTLTSLTEFNEIRIFEVTRMNDPADHTTHVGDHGKEYVITDSGVELNQSVEWKGAYELKASYMPMLCAIRGNDTVSALQITDTYIDDGNHRMYDVGTGGFTGYPSSYKKDIRKHTLLSEKSGLTATLEIFESPDKTGAASRLFPNANTYNKIYYAVCGATANHTTAAGEKWRSRCKFTFQITPGTDIEY